MAKESDTLFPLLRHLSVRVTPLLARFPVTANQITLASLALGLGCAWAMTGEGRAMTTAGGVMLVLCYLLDNCDGEIAGAGKIGKTKQAFTTGYPHCTHPLCLFH